MKRLAFVLALAACHDPKLDRDTEDMEIRLINQKIETLERSVRLNSTRESIFMLCLDSNLSTEMQVSDMVAQIQTCIGRTRGM